MIVFRTVLHAKIGKASNVVARIKEALASLSEEQIAQLRPRILTDLSGRFDTVVVETTHESLAAFEQVRQAMLQAAPTSGEGSLSETMETGHNEYWTIEY